MNECLEKLPILDYIPNAVRSDELKGVPVDSELTAKVAKLMTPEDVLGTLDFSRPDVINLLRYPNFDSLLRDREKVRRLQLLPVKTDEEYVRYHQQSKDILISDVLSNLGDSPMVLALNAFPYCLPEDLGQYIVWVKNRQVEEKEVIGFIGRCMQLFHLSEEDLILFERPSQTLSKLVKGTFKELRHIHFWMRLKEY